MALPFSQSTRSLQADRGTSSLVGLAIALIVLLLWALWLFGASITRYETGTIVGISREGRIVAQFSAETANQIQQGQNAYIRLQSMNVGSAFPATSQQSGGAVPAVVANILLPISDDSFQVTLSPQDDIRAFMASGQPLVGEVAVEVERVSPALLIAHASGQFIDLPSLSVSPQ